MDPEPSTVAPSRRARRHVCGDLEIGEPGPYTGLVHAEDGKVLGLDGRDVGFVGDGESASGQIVKALEQSQIFFFVVENTEVGTDGGCKQEREREMSWGSNR